MLAPRAPPNFNHCCECILSLLHVLAQAADVDDDAVVTVLEHAADALDDVEVRSLLCTVSIHAFVYCDCIGLFALFPVLLFLMLLVNSLTFVLPP